MPLTLNEIKSKDYQFIKEWENETNEQAEAKSFWDQFFGDSRRRVATFEKPVKKAEAQQGYIDLRWKAKILVKQKSRGKTLDTAYKQAKDYFPGLKDSNLKQFNHISDFNWFKGHKAMETVMDSGIDFKPLLPEGTRSNIYLNFMINIQAGYLRDKGRRKKMLP